MSYSFEFSLVVFIICTHFLLKRWTFFLIWLENVPYMRPRKKMQRVMVCRLEHRTGENFLCQILQNQCSLLISSYTEEWSVGISCVLDNDGLSKSQHNFATRPPATLSVFFTGVFAHNRNLYTYDWWSTASHNRNSQKPSCSIFFFSNKWAGSNLRAKFLSITCMAYLLLCVKRKPLVSSRYLHELII